jgi:hypothetical protein
MRKPPPKIVDQPWQDGGQKQPSYRKQIVSQEGDQPWQDMGLLTPTTIRAFKGANTLDPFSIDPSFATRMKNLTGDGTSMTVRPGTTTIGSALPTAIQGIGLWKDSEIHAIAGGVWYKLQGTTWVSMKTGLSTTAKMSFCNFKGDLSQISLIAANGSGSFYYDGTAVQTLGGIPAGANFVDQHDNRVYAAKENSVLFSALRKSQDWTTVDEAGEIVIETDDGELINGIKGGHRHLMVFKQSSFLELWGTGPLNYTLQTISKDIGLLNNSAIATVEGTPFWADANAIYNYGGSVPRKDFSLPVKGYMDDMNKLQTAKVCAGANKNSFYLAIPSSSATDPDTILEYDTIFQVWYVWRDISPLAIFDFQNTLHMGDAGGRILKFGGTLDNNAAINWEWVSPPIGSGSYAQRSQWYRMWYVLDVPAGSTANFYLSNEAQGENWTLVKSIVGANLQSGRIIIPLDTVANANWVRVRVTGNGPVTINEFDYQRRSLPMY